MQPSGRESPSLSLGMRHCRAAVDNKSSFEGYLIRWSRGPPAPAFLLSNSAPLLATLETVASYSYFLDVVMEVFQPGKLSPSYYPSPQS